jgi:signal transduction histidine kinase
VVTDITHRIERERQLQEAKDEAEAARRDAEVHRQRAEEASQSKSRFLAGVVHDLKSPLTAILGYAKLLQDECDAPQATHAGNIFKATENIRTMSETLLELSRLESGGLHLDVEARDVRPVVEDVAQTLGRRAREKGVDLQVNLPDQAAVAPIHPESLRRAVHNLVQNAVKYSAAGDRVALQATTDPTGPDASWTEASARRNGTPASGQTNDAAGNGRRVIVTVRDTGPGIAPDFLDTLFEPFARNASDTEGTGLGLSVTKELVEAMRGTIRVESEVGTGTCFQIALPMAPPREADASC